MDQQQEWPTPGTVACQQAMASRLEALETLRKDVTEIKDIITAWNSVKGFAKTIGWVGGFVKWTSIVAIAVATLWYMMTHGGQIPPWSEK